MVRRLGCGQLAAERGLSWRAPTSAKVVWLSRSAAVRSAVSQARPRQAGSLSFRSPRDYDQDGP